MTNLNMTKGKYTRGEVIAIVSSIVVYVGLNYDEFNEWIGWVKFSVYVLFNLLIMVAGQKAGNIKELIEEFHRIRDGPGTAESKLLMAEYNLKVQAAYTGICWEDYYREMDKKKRKEQKKLEKQQQKANNS